MNVMLSLPKAWKGKGKEKEKGVMGVRACELTSLEYLDVYSTYN